MKVSKQKFLGNAAEKDPNDENHVSEQTKEFHVLNVCHIKSTM